MKTLHPINQVRSLWSAVVAVVALFVVGCGGKHDHAAHDDHEAEHEHGHEARHGGTAVVLGEEEFHVEFTHGENPGALQAYFFDGHMENYVRIAAPAFAATVVVEGEERPVVFAAVANAASGESVGDTALFEATAPWLKGQPGVSLKVPELVVKGATYKDITAAIPAR